MNKKLTAITILGGFIVLLVTMALAPPADAAYDSSMQTYWKLDETSGWTASDSTGNIPAAWRNGNTVTQAGKLNNSLWFFSGNVQFGNPTPLQLTNNFTVSTWFKDTGTSSSNAGLYLREGSFRFGTNGYSHQLTVQVGSDVGSGWSNTYTSSTSFSMNAWHFGSVTFQDGIAKIYLDGNLVGTSGNLGAVPNTGNASMGALYGSPGRNDFIGNIDDMAVFNTAKSGADLYSIYINGNHAVDVPTRSAEIASYLTGTGLSFSQVELDAMASAAINDPGGAQTLISGNTFHFEPLLKGSGVSGDPYYYDFSEFGTLVDANSWAWGTGALAAYSSLNDWYLKVDTGALITADGNALYTAGEQWILKTGGVNGSGDGPPSGVPELPVGLMIPLLGALGVGLFFIRKNFCKQKIQ